MRLNENVKIIGKKVVLVPYERHHVPRYHDWMEDKEIRRLTGSERLSLDEEYEMQGTWRNDEDKLSFIVLSREMIEGGSGEIEAMIGDVNLFMHNKEQSGELEIMIAEKKARCSGAGTEAASLMISYALNNLPVEQFFVKITDDNSSSLHIFEEKLKFRRVSHSDAFGEYTLELPLSENNSFKKLLAEAAIDSYRTTSRITQT